MATWLFSEFQLNLRYLKLPLSFIDAVDLEADLLLWLTFLEVNKLQFGRVSQQFIESSVLLVGEDDGSHRRVFHTKVESNFSRIHVVRTMQMKDIKSLLECQ